MRNLTKLLAIAGAGAAAATYASGAMAGVHVVGWPRVVVVPRVAYAPPGIAYVAAPPVYYAPRRYYGPAYYYGPTWHYRWHDWHRGYRRW